MIGDVPLGLTLLTLLAALALVALVGGSASQIESFIVVISFLEVVIAFRTAPHFLVASCLCI